jgi:hypothetical protein
MAGSKKNQRFDQYLLRGKLRHEGFEKWRYDFCAVHKDTGVEKKFFIEMYLVNPAISPKVAVIAQKSRLAFSENDLQYALAGTMATKNAEPEVVVRPSYVLIKAGMFGENGKQINNFLPSAQLSYSKDSGVFKVGDCSFSSYSLTGSVYVSEDDLREKPELSCNAGAMDWELTFKRDISCGLMGFKQDTVWVPTGAKTSFSGTIHIDGEEFIAYPQNSFGYSDKKWGIHLNDPYFHLSSSKLTSIITGKSMTNSCLVIDGEYNGKIQAFLNVDGHNFRIARPSLFKCFSEFHECTQMPTDEDGEKLHWSLSIHKGKYVIDIDVFCRAEEMFVRDYEIPQGRRTLIKVLGGGTGKGEVRIYKKIHKNLELLEHANIYDVSCDFGQKEEIGKLDDDFENTLD